MLTFHSEASLGNRPSISLFSRFLTFQTQLLVVFPCCHYSQIVETVGLKVPFQSLLLMVFSFLVPCGTTPLFMNVCFILFDSLLHDWVLETRLSFVAVLILFGLCCVSQGSPSSGSLWDSDPVLSIGLLLAY